MIVNPWFFYLMSVCNGAKTTTLVLSLVGGFAFALFVIFYLCMKLEGIADKEEIDEMAKVAKVIGWLFGASLTVYILTPSENTLLMMQAAKLATADNVNAIFEALKAAIDYTVTVLK